MKKYLAFSLLFVTTGASAQIGLNEMIAAEKCFAAYAVAHNTKQAFLKFIDTGAVMFNGGEPLNGYQLWMKKEKRPGVLNWRPRFAEIAASANFGYTCGPWTFQPQTLNDSIVASGYFFTVWHKTTTGDWKFIVDVGTDAGPMLMDTSVIKITKEKGKGTPKTLLEAEQKFIRLYKEDTAKAYAQFLSDKVVLAKEGSALTEKINTWRPTPAAAPGDIVFTLKGSGAASSGDLGYTYGSAEVAGKKETYLRIWRHELTGWKIAVQMVRL